MKLAIAAALALLAAHSLHAQATQTAAAAAPDYSTATPMTGNWTYSPATGGPPTEVEETIFNAICEYAAAGSGRRNEDAGGRETLPMQMEIPF